MSSQRQPLRSLDIETRELRESAIDSASIARSNELFEGSFGENLRRYNRKFGRQRPDVKGGRT